MALGYKDVISSGVQYGKSYDEIRQKLAETGNLTGASIADLDLVLDRDKEKEVEITLPEQSKMKVGMKAKEDLITKVNDYKSLLDEEGFATEMFSGDALGRMQAKRANIITAVKKAEALGALDKGLLEFADQLVGEDPRKTITNPNLFGAKSRKISAQLDEYASMLGDDVKSTAELLGVTGEETGVVSRDEVMNNINKLYEYSTENPDDPRSQKFMDDWDNDRISLTTGKLKDEFRELTPFEQKEKDQQDTMTLSAEDEALLAEEDEAGMAERVFMGETGLIQNITEDFGNLKTNLIESGTEIANNFTDAKDATVKGIEALKKGDKAEFELQKDIYEGKTTLTTLGGLVDVAGSVGKLIGDVTGTGLEALDDATKNVVSSSVEGAFKTVIDEISQTEAGADGLQALQEGAERWNEFAEANPETAKDISNVMGIMDGITVVTGGIAAKKGIQVGLKAGAKGVTKGAEEVGKVGVKAKEVASKVTPKAKTPEVQVAKVKTELDEITKSKAPLRNLAEKSRKEGVDVNEELSKSNVMQGTVDDAGTITTRGAGGAVEQYNNKFIKGLDDAVSKGLVEEGKDVSLDNLEKAMISAIEADKSLTGSIGEKAIARVSKEIKAMEKYTDADGNLPLTKINDLKKSMYKNINYDNVKTAAGEKTLIKGMKEFIEDSSDNVAVKDLNKELSKHYTVINYLDKLDGAKVEGGRLGKYFGATVGAIAGAGAGVATGGLAGFVMPIVGGVVGSKLKGILMKRTFGKIIDQKIKTNKSLTKAEAKTVNDKMKKDKAKTEKKTKSKSKAKHAMGGVAGVQVDEEGNVTYNPVAGLLGIGGMTAASKLARIKFNPKTIAQNIDKKDKDIMEAFVDKTRLREKPSKQIDTDAQIIARAMGLNENMTNSKLADKFSEVLDVKTVPSNLPVASKS